MNHIKHFSFDLWLTLIRSNPLFKEQRADYFYNNFNRKAKSVEEIKFIFQTADACCNAINEKTGKNISAEEMYLMVVSQINESTAIIKDVDLHALYSDMEHLVLQYMPEVFCDQTLATLDRIKNRPDTTLNILSNTAFIKGATLKKVNIHLGISKYFDFEIYSDEVGVSKPNIDIYHHLIENVSRVRQHRIEPEEIIHVGDNYHADISGAQKAGIQAFQINTTQQSITHLFN
ncbi:MAG: HAD family hydrolase [Ferruginibacter sp.]